MPRVGSSVGQDLSISSSFEQGIQKALAGDHQGAIQAFDQALLQDSENAEIYGNRCVVRHRSGDLPGAIADCQRAMELYLAQGNTDKYQYAHRMLKRLKQPVLQAS